PLAVSSAGKKVFDRLSFKSASNYLTFNPDQSIFTVTLLDKDSQQETLDATFEPNKVSSVFVVGLTSIVDSIGFTFVTKLTVAMPTALPATGFAPQSSRSDVGLPPSTVYLLVSLVALTLLGGTRLAVVRRRTRARELATASTAGSSHQLDRR